jgi:hypothetical protein
MAKVVRPYNGLRRTCSDLQKQICSQPSGWGCGVDNLGYAHCTCKRKRVPVPDGRQAKRVQLPYCNGDGDDLYDNPSEPLGYKVAGAFDGSVGVNPHLSHRPIRHESTDGLGWHNRMQQRLRAKDVSSVYRRIYRHSAEMATPDEEDTTNMLVRSRPRAPRVVRLKETDDPNDPNRESALELERRSSFDDVHVVQSRPVRGNSFYDGDVDIAARVRRERQILAGARHRRTRRDPRERSDHIQQERPTRGEMVSFSVVDNRFPDPMQQQPDPDPVLSRSSTHISSQHGSMSSSGSRTRGCTTSSAFPRSGDGVFAACRGGVPSATQPMELQHGRCAVHAP